MNQTPESSKILLVCIGFNTKMSKTKRIDVDHLEQIFSSFGKLSKILIFSRKSLLKAFIEFEDIKSSTKAAKALNNTILPIHGRITVYYSAIDHIEIENIDMEHKVFQKQVNDDMCAKISVSTNSDSKTGFKSPLINKEDNRIFNKENIHFFSGQRKVINQRPLLEKGVNFKMSNIIQEKNIEPIKSNSPKITESSKVVLISNIENLFESKQEIFNLFSCFGNIKKLIFMKNLHKALVEYFSVDGAALCIKNLHCVKINDLILKVNYSKYKTIDLAKNNKNINSINYNEVLLVSSALNRFELLKNVDIKNVSPVVSVNVRQSEKCKPLDIYLLIEQVAKPKNIKIKNVNDDINKIISLELSYESIEESLKVMMKLHNRTVGDSNICIEFN